VQGQVDYRGQSTFERTLHFVGEYVRDMKSSAKESAFYKQIDARNPWAPRERNLPKFQ